MGTTSMNPAYRFAAALVFGTSLLAITHSAYAVGETIPHTSGQTFSAKKFYVIDYKQDIEITFSLNPDGNGAFTTRFSNGKKIDGDHMFAKVSLVDADGNLIGEGQHRVGIGSAGAGGTKVRIEPRTFNIGAERAARVARVTFDAGHFDVKDNAKFWKRVVQFGGALTGSVDNGFLIFPMSLGMKAALPSVNF